MSRILQKTVSRQEIAISRFAYLKRDAQRILKWMRDAGVKRVRLTGKRGLWRVRGFGSVVNFARFVSVEAHYDSEKAMAEAK